MHRRSIRPAILPCLASQPAIPTPTTADPAGALARTRRNTLIPLGAIAAGFGFGLSLSPALAQTSDPPPPQPSAPATADKPAGGEATLPTVSVKGIAEETAKDTLQTTTTTIGKGRQEIRDIPQAITVVTERLLDDAKLDTLKQALHYTSGITFAATENGTDQDIRLRGFPVATTGDLMIDGMRDPSQYDRDSFNYDRIEVLRGAASMLFGRGSTGGVINQVTKKPALIDLSEVMTTIGTGKYIRLTGDLNVRTGEHEAFRLNAMVNKADNYGAEIDKRGIAPSYSWGIDTPDEVTIGAYYLDVENIPMSSLRYLGGGIAEAIPARNFYGTQSDYLTSEVTFGTAAWRHRFDGGGELRSQVRSGVFHRSSWGTVAGFCSNPLTATGTCPDGSFPVTRDTLNDDTAMTRFGLSPRKDKFRTTYVQSDYSRTFGWFGLSHNVLAGVDAAFETVDRYGSYGRVVTNYNKGGTRVGTPNDGTRTASVPVYRPTSDYDSTALGAYAQDLIALNDRWKLLGGLRVDRFSAVNGQVEYAPNGSIVAKPTSELEYDDLWSHRWGVLYQPSRSRSYHLSYGTSFNTSADTYQYTTQAVANVPAESSRNIELGAKHDWFNGTLSTRAAIFRTDKFDERTTDVDFAGTSYTLSGQRHSQGIDMDIVGWLTPRIEIYASYTWIQEAKIDKAGVVLDNEGFSSTAAGQPVGLSPRHSGAVWLNYRATPSLRIGVGARGASENRPLQGATGAASTTARVPGYVAYDAMAEYTFTPDLFVQFTVNNVTNKVYGDQLYPTFYTPGEGRSAKLSLGARF